ncbi:hypothetical protein LSH36_399g05000 [Paralvinella palmiformis]|uniref:Uncharacterized protein n=1 Tax=Paralvinella palmiformis TaxID=53620 RepID=A0AAD9MYX3_9ANNE|nr:hypothetical protein LSH36_399g05000 [Paralvinella palmiformis]
MAQRRDYIRQRSLDSRVSDWKRPTESYPGYSNPRPVPVFHERFGLRDREVKPSWQGYDKRTEHKQIHNLADAEDIIFNRSSGVTRIPAARVRRHSVQFGESGSRIIPEPRGANRSFATYPDSSASRISGYRGPSSGDQRRTYGDPDLKATIHDRNSFDDTLDQQRRTLTGVGRSRYQDNVTQRKPANREQIPYQLGTVPDTSRYTSRSTSSQLPVFVQDNIQSGREPIPIDLTPIQSNNSSHIICHKGSNYGRSRSVSDNSSSYMSGMGVSAVDQCYPLAGGDSAQNERPTYSRQLSSSNIMLSSDRQSPSDVKEKYVKRNIHVRRHSVSTPSALRVAPKPKLLQDFQDWTSHATADHGKQQHTVTQADVKSPEVTSNESGVQIPVRRYSVTYAPKTEQPHSESHLPTDPTTGSQQLVTPGDKTKNKKKSSRRPCRPLSIVNEGTSPPTLTNVDGEEFDSGVVTDDSVNESSTYGRQDQVVPTSVNIERDEGNVNIIAGGNVNICLKTDKPLSMVGRSGADRSSEFAFWTKGSDLAEILERSSSAVNENQTPMGMWRQGNVIVDSVSPSGQNGMPYGSGSLMSDQLPFAAQPLPMVQPIPMIYHPYLNPELRGGFGYQGPTGQNKSIYSPLCVDTSEQQANFLPFPIRRPVFRFNQTPSQGLLRRASGGSGTSSPVRAAQDRCQNTNSVPAVGTPVGTQHRRAEERVGHHPNAIISQPIRDGAENDVVNRTDDVSPPPQIDVREMIADFENKSDAKVDVPEFGADFGDAKLSTSRRTSKDLDRLEISTDSKYKLKVEDGDNWKGSPSPTDGGPPTLHAYIAEMSISERKYQDNQTVTPSP